jgi:histidinol dehydrogenase
VIRYDAGALRRDAQDVVDFARREGLTAHASAVEIRKRHDDMGEIRGET